ncbi:hypothetical protein [Streptomyces sp. cg36]|uniref:hypothetical protein n=1 Tax=Streptomyces sp. cg36 TaxID=3238798 RepID=UPI0034E1ACAC
MNQADFGWTVKRGKVTAMAPGQIITCAEFEKAFGVDCAADPEFSIDPDHRHFGPVTGLRYGGRLSRRQRLWSWCWEHGGRQLRNARLRLAGRSRA